MILKSFILPFMVLTSIVFPACGYDFGGIDYLNPSTGMTPGLPNDAQSALGSPVKSTSSSVILADVSGSWALTFYGALSRNVDLVLYQYDGEVFGYGTTTAGTIAQDITAAGYVNGNIFDLRLVTVGGTSMYKLDLNFEDGAVSGIYNGYSLGSDPRAGTCSGQRYAASTLTTSTYSGVKKSLTLGNIHRYDGQVSA